jgi:hypothetical protein
MFHNLLEHVLILVILMCFHRLSGNGSQYRSSFSICVQVLLDHALQVKNNMLDRLTHLYCHVIEWDYKWGFDW